jgi:hypothetical protein
MRHELPPLPARVYHQSISFLGNTLSLCQLSGNHHHFDDDGRFRLSELSKRRDVFPGNNKYMGRRDWMSITEGYHLFILIENISLYLTSYDSTKNAVSLTHISPAKEVDAENVTIVLGYRQANQFGTGG